MRIKEVIGLVILFGGPFSIPSQGQVVATWTDTSGNYSNAANWSTLTVPNNGGGTTYDVVVNGTGADTVTFDVSGTTVDSLALGPGETFQDNGSSPALTGGSLTNNGTVNWGKGASLMLGTISNFGAMNFTGRAVLAVSSGPLANNGSMNFSVSDMKVNGDYQGFAGIGSTLELQNGSNSPRWGCLGNCHRSTVKTTHGEGWKTQHQYRQREAR